MKIVSICQPHFFPWLGYFNMLYNCDEFIFLDNVQYNRRSWQNRVHIYDNYSITKKKLISLSVIDYHRHKKINDYQISKENIAYFKDSIYQTYKDTMYYSNISDLLTYNLERNINNNLAQFNINLIEILSNYLNIDLKYDLSSKINITNKKKFLILDILNFKKADSYLANDGSLAYADEHFFSKYKINFKTHNYNHPNYQQIFKNKKVNFTSHLSIVDALFHLDKKTEDIVKTFKIIF